MIPFAAILLQNNNSVMAATLYIHKETCTYNAKYTLVLHPKGIHPSGTLHRKNHSSDSPGNHLGQLSSVQSVKSQVDDNQIIGEKYQFPGRFG